jgi:hypothetical protein
MMRFLVVTLVAALNLAAITGLALGQNGGTPPGSTSQATKSQSPAAPGKGQAGKAPTQAKGAPTPPDKKAAGKPGDGCFDLFNTGNEMVNSYLMMLASHYAYTPALGLTSRDNATFSKKFEDTFRPFGMKDFKLIADSNSQTKSPIGKAWAVRAMVFSNAKVVVVSFRGSEMDLSNAKQDTWRNWVGTNAQTNLRPDKLLGPGIEVHDGFATALDAVYKGLAAEIVRQGGFKQKKVFVTGHSLGGALATLCAARMQKDGTGSAAVYTFGSPRVGNDKFQAAFRLAHQRWVNQNDLVTQLPPEVLGYRPVGTFNHILPGGKIQMNDKDAATPANEVLKFLDVLAGPPINGIVDVGNAGMMHSPPLYSKALYDNLPAGVKQKMPPPPTK